MIFSTSSSSNTRFFRELLALLLLSSCVLVAGAVRRTPRVRILNTRASRIPDNASIGQVQP